MQKPSWGPKVAGTCLRTAFEHADSEDPNDHKKGLCALSCWILEHLKICLHIEPWRKRFPKPRQPAFEKPSTKQHQTKVKYQAS